MSTPIEKKFSTNEIKERFDNDVERFSNVETGQTSTIDASLAMELITQAAYKSTTSIKRILDIGCGAGNNTLTPVNGKVSRDKCLGGIFKFLILIHSPDFLFFAPLKGVLKRAPLEGVLN